MAFISKFNHPVDFFDYPADYSLTMLLTIKTFTMAIMSIPVTNMTILIILTTFFYHTGD